MREIEFRIRARNKEWYYGMPLSETNKDTVVFRSFDNNYYDLFADATTLGQYTGLKDKNGKKIFEGDIIDYINEDLPSYVVYNCGEFELYNYDTVVSLIETRSYEMEVIGNIYENPELLKGE